MTIPERHFPEARLRRLRQTDWTRRLVAENHLTPDDLILPLFIMEGNNTTEAIKT
ncbi:MAG: porphobilinogen synthase, partial [Alphaproteobacteria bacterium]|nr:porphobilinogen synthase [Alphaproteobacteria bacterium]